MSKYIPFYEVIINYPGPNLNNALISDAIAGMVFVFAIPATARFGTRCILVYKLRYMCLYLMQYADSHAEQPVLCMLLWYAEFAFILQQLQSTAFCPFGSRYSIRTGWPSIACSGLPMQFGW